MKADQFACAVLKAEGMDKDIYIEWRKKIRNKFIEKFSQEINSNEFDKNF